MNGERYCPNCEEYRDTHVEERTEVYTVRGKRISLSVGVTVCATCGKTFSDEGNGQKVLDQVNAAYREQENLLTPEEIKDIRTRYALSQRSLAGLLGMSEATVNRYEQGKLQDPAHDALLRACKNPSFVRQRVAVNGHLLSDWQRQRVEEALGGGKPDLAARSGATVGDFSMRMFAPDEVSFRTGFRRFDFTRYAGAVIFFCKKLCAIPQTKLNKLLFYADFLNFKVATVSLTGTSYRKIQWGPVPPDYDLLRSEMEEKEIVSVEERDYGNGVTGLDILLGPGADSIDLQQVFTTLELAVLDRVADEFRGATATQISSRSHSESVWRETEEKKLISYEKAPGLSLVM